MGQSPGPLAALGLTGAEASAYRDLVRTGPHPEEQVDACVVERLLGAGLILRRDGQVDAVPPGEALHHGAALRQREVDRLRATAESLAADYRRRPGGGREAVEVVEGSRQVMAAATQMAERAETVMRGLDRGPYFHAEPLPGQAQQRAQTRGVQWRVVYEGASLREAGPDGWAMVGRTEGEVARVAARLPMKLLLCDNVQGLIGLSTGPGRGEALLVRGSLLLDALIELFEREWEAAIPVPHRGVELRDVDGITAQDRELVAMLSAGLTDGQISKNLGISPRTLHRRIADLQRVLRVESRFQLGVQASRQGLV